MTHRKLFSISLAILTLTAATFFVGCDEEKITPAKESAPAPQPKAAKPAPTPTPAPKPIVSLVTVKLQTTMGDIVLELNKTAAPVTVNNFLTYTRQGSYNGTIFHRVISKFPGPFMIQGGGLTPNMARKQVNAPIVNEASNGLKNARGTISMARTNAPNSATNQFFINHKDNFNLDYVKGGSPGYAVFGKVVSGMNVIDTIAAVPVTQRAGRANVPVEPITITSVTVLN